jgi:hypothetical protein
MLAVGPHGRLWREVWHSAEGAIMQSGADYVTLPTTEGEMQFWAHSFAEAYFQLTNKPWQAGEEAR